MFVANDRNDNRVYADSSERITECFCPVCKEQLIHRIGKYKRSHFAHKVDTNCYYGKNKDNKCEWHIRMQELFPKEYREYRFEDSENGDIHIADIYIPEQNIVIEFQHSSITLEEYNSRTIFHLKNGRAIVWVFDESNEKCSEFGKFKEDDLFGMGWPYEKLNFKWLRNPRKFLVDSLDMVKYSNCYAIYVRTNREDDGVRRIIKQDCGFEYVTLSFQKIYLNELTDYRELFCDDNYWIQKSDLYDEFIKRQQENALRAQLAKQQKRIMRTIPYRRNNKRNYRF